MTKSRWKSAAWIAAFPVAVGLVAAAPSLSTAAPHLQTVVVSGPVPDAASDPSPPAELPPPPEVEPAPIPAPLDPPAAEPVPAQVAPPAPTPVVAPTPGPNGDGPQETTPATPEAPPVAVAPAPDPVLWFRDPRGYCFRTVRADLPAVVQPDPTCPDGQPAPPPAPPHPSMRVRVVDGVLQFDGPIEMTDGSIPAPQP